VPVAEGRQLICGGKKLTSYILTDEWLVEWIDVNMLK
jgi:hypothetical protein